MKPQKSKSQLGCIGLRSTASTTSFKALDPTNLRKGSLIVPQTVDWNSTIGNSALLPSKAYKELILATQTRDVAFAGWKSERKRDQLKQSKLMEECGSENVINIDAKGLKGALKKKLRRDPVKRPNSLDKQLSEQKRALTPPQVTDGPKVPKSNGSFFGSHQAFNPASGSGLFSQRARGQNESLASSAKQKVIPAQSSPRSHTLSEVPLFQAPKLKNGTKVTKGKQMSMQVNQVDSNIEYKRPAPPKPDQAVGRRSASIGKKLTASTPPASPHQGPAEGLLTAISPLFKTQLQLHRDHLLGSQLSSCGSMSSPFAETRTRATQGCSYNSGLSKQSPEHPTNGQLEGLPKKCLWHPSKAARFYTYLDPEADVQELQSAGMLAPQDGSKQPVAVPAMPTATGPTGAAILKSSNLAVPDLEDPAAIGYASVCSLCAVKLAQKGYRLEELPVEQEQQEEQQQVLFEFHERARLLVDLAGFVDKSLKAKLGLVQLHYKQQFQVLMASATEIDELYNKIQAHLAQINQNLIEESQQETVKLSGARQSVRAHKAELMKFARVLEREYQDGLELTDWECTQKQLGQYNETLLQIGEECKRVFSCRCEVSSLQHCEITLGNIEAKFQDVLRSKRKELQLKREENQAGDTFLTTLERLESLGKTMRSRLALRQSAEQTAQAGGASVLRGINSLAQDLEHSEIKLGDSEEKDLGCVSFEGAADATEKIEYSPSKEYSELLRKIDDNQSLNLHYYSSLMYDHSSVPHNDIQTPELGGAKDQIPAYLQTHLHSLLSQTHPHISLREANASADLTGGSALQVHINSVLEAGDKILASTITNPSAAVGRESQHSSAPERVVGLKHKPFTKSGQGSVAAVHTAAAGQPGIGTSPTAK